MHSRNQFRKLFHGMPEPHFLLDTAANIIAMNAAAQRFLDLPDPLQHRLNLTDHCQTANTEIFDLMARLFDNSDGESGLLIIHNRNMTYHGAVIDDPDNLWHRRILLRLQIQEMKTDLPSIKPVGNNNHYFDQMALALVKEFSADHALIGALRDNDKLEIELLGSYSRAGATPAQIDIRHTPCLDLYARQFDAVNEPCAMLGNENQIYYSGVLMRTTQKEICGHLCIISRHPVSNHPHQLQLLHSFAARCAAELQLRREPTEMEQQNEIEQRDQSDKVIQSQSHFLSNISHEFRTPLNGIIGLAQLIYLEHHCLSSEQLQDYCQSIVESGQILEKIVDDLVNISVIELGDYRPQLRKFDINTLLLALQIEGNNNNQVVLDIKLAEPSDNLVLTDQNALREVLRQFVSNAAKFNKPSGLVQIYCERAAENYLRVCVTDQGLGIAVSNQQAIFEPLERLNAKEQQIPGNGIGLALCKYLAESMGAQIGVRSVLNQGSCFYVELPLLCASTTTTNTIDRHVF